RHWFGAKRIETGRCARRARLAKDQPCVEGKQQQSECDKPCVLLALRRALRGVRARLLELAQLTDERAGRTRVGQIEVAAVRRPRYGAAPRLVEPRGHDVAALTRTVSRAAASGVVARERGPAGRADADGEHTHTRTRSAPRGVTHC